MATLAQSNLTLADWAKRTHPDGSIADIAELLSQTNEVLEDCVWKEGNLPTGERVVIRTGLPTTYYRALNAGIPSSKSTTAQVDEACAMIEARSEMDVDLAKLNGNTNQFRLSEDSAFIESMNQTFVNGLFKGNTATDPKQFLGFENRYTSTSAGNGSNVLLAGGNNAATQGLSSIYLVCWSDRTVYCPFPKGSNAGLMKEDLGVQTIFDGTNRMQAYVSRFQWKPGLAVKDWRYVVRIANIPTLTADGIFTTAGSGAQGTASATNVIKLMARAMDKIPSFGGVKSCFYMNRTIYSGLRIQAMDRTQGVLDIEKGLSQFGTPMSWLTFQGIPCRKVDALTNAEGVIS